MLHVFRKSISKHHVWILYAVTWAKYHTSLTSSSDRHFVLLVVEN